MLRIFFATDVHGSDICWKKFISGAKFYEANVLVLGGDMTGKAIVPIVKNGKGEWRVELMDQVSILRDEDKVKEMESTIANKGYYPVRLEADQLAEYEQHPETVERLFTAEVLKRVGQWMEYADSKLDGTGIHCYVCPGNDDVFEVDEAVKQSKSVTLAEGHVTNLDDSVTMISTGWSNHTPWNTHRELDEEQLGEKIDGMLADVPDVHACVFNLHCPAHHSGLDEAPELDEQMRPKYAGHILKSVGSTAVRSAIERNQPALALFGHIHEGRGITHIGKTMCINPGSSYEQGVLLGARVDLDGAKMASHTLTSG